MGFGDGNSRRLLKWEMISNFSSSMYLRLEVKKNILTVIIEIHKCDFVGGYFMNQWEIYNKAGFVLGGWSLGSLGLHYSNFHLVVSLLCLFKIDIHIRLMTSPIQRRHYQKMVANSCQTSHSLVLLSMIVSNNVTWKQYMLWSELMFTASYQFSSR
ncbi:hypothetical protein OIU78_022723 [Salix suchowensis]|nr:hypothetical protein OIU78_022723 [Salix suchowensis]